MDIEKIVREEVRKMLSAYAPPGLVDIGSRVDVMMAKGLTLPVLKAKLAKKKAKAKLVHRQPTNAETNVLAALANGFFTAGTIANYTEGALNARQVGQTLKRLVDQGLVTKHGERRFTTYRAVAQNGAAS